jgi:hypothetical protein
VSDGLAVLALAAVVTALLVARRGRQARAGTVEVVADERGVRRVLADGRREAVAWPEVNAVEVFTTRVGPHGAAGGAVVLFGDEHRGCIVPLDRLAASDLLAHVHHLPGFDTRAVLAAVQDPPDAPGIRALLSARPLSRTTTCWRRPAP